MTSKHTPDYLRLRNHSLKQARFAKRNIMNPALRASTVRYYVRMARLDHLKALRGGA